MLEMLETLARFAATNGPDAKLAVGFILSGFVIAAGFLVWVVASAAAGVVSTVRAMFRPARRGPRFGSRY